MQRFPGATSRSETLGWFEQARAGLFLHYGLYSILGRGEWVMFHEAIPPDEYETLADRFDPSGFDADAIARLAVEAEMSYVNLTSCHHEGFCLWDSKVESFNSMRFGGRDLVAEMAAACERHGLGFFTYHTYTINWRHPSTLSPELFRSGRPHYENVPDRYTLATIDDWPDFWRWTHGCIEELLAINSPLAGVWLDLIVGAYHWPDQTPATDTYRLIRESRPETLVSFKQGLTGDEDFASPEFQFRSLADRMREQGKTRAADVAAAAWERNRHKHNEICMTLQQSGRWGIDATSKHHGPDHVLASLGYAAGNRCNLLVNTGPLADGSIHPDDVACLREVGKRIRRDGWPEPRSDIPTGKSDAGVEA
ncbi:MAG: alpha-L-fucosidase [Planctomycetota bacterium]